MHAVGHGGAQGLVFPDYLLGGYSLVQLGRLGRRRLHPGLRQDDAELVAAEAADHVGGPRVAQQDLADPLEHGVAGRMAVGIVQRLQPIDVEIEHSAGRAVAFLEGRSEEHTSELQSLMRTSYAVFCLKKTKTTDNIT